MAGKRGKRENVAQLMFDGKWHAVEMWQSSWWHLAAAELSEIMDGSD